MQVLPEIAAEDDRNSFITSDSLHNMVEAYLHSAGMREVAVDLRHEAQAKRGFANNTRVLEQKRCVDSSSVKSPTPWLPLRALELLLSPYSVTKSVIHHLLRNGEAKLTRQFRLMGLPPPNALCLGHALHANQRQMWSSQDDADALYVKPWRGEGPKVPIFGTLHQLIEVLTHVSVLPLSTLSEKKVMAQEQFTLAFLRQHRYFTSSHTVLAKLMERFIVPFSVKLGFEHFEAHGITIHAPGTSLSTLLPASRITSTCSDEGEVRNRVNHFSPSATLWLCVCRKIQTRVLSVLALWLREHPQHFDEEMHHCISHFLDNCCDVPPPWSDCPSQLIAIVEIARDCLAASAAAVVGERQRTHYGASKTRQRCLHNSPPTLTTSSPAHTSAVNEDSLVIISEETTSALLLCTPSDFGPVEPLGSHWVKKLEEVVRLCVAIPVERYATALTALHLHLFLVLPAEDLLQVAHRSSAAYLCSNSFRLSPVGMFLSASSDLSSWTTSVLLHAAALDGFQARNAMDRLSPAKNFVDIYKRLVELVIAQLRLNNLHGVTAVVKGLHHPIVQRVVTRLRSLASFPESALQNIAHLNTVLGICSDNEEKRGQQLEDYIGGILDTNIHSLIPPLQNYIEKMVRLQREMPSFLTARTDDLYPSTHPSEAAGEVVIVHWRKYMILDEMLDQIMSWQTDAQPSSRDKEFEGEFLKQKEKVVHDPWQLAQMANGLLSLL